MRSRHSSLPSLGLVMVYAFSIFPITALARTGPDVSVPWNTFIADVTLQQQRLHSDGSPVARALPPLRYRWERAEVSTGWKTTLTFMPAASAEGIAGGARPAQFDVARIVDEGDGTPPSVFNRLGQRMTLPTDRELGLATAAPLLPGTARMSAGAGHRSSLLAGREWIDAVIVEPEKHSDRRGDLKRRFGPRHGTIRGLDRFLRIEGDETEEILTDASSALPIELNIIRAGRLVWHGRVSYSRDAKGVWTRRAMHVEQLLNDEGERLATDLELANVRLEVRGTR